MTCIILYLAAIVAANGAVATFGQIALPFTATLLIPFDLVTRDILHQRWESDRLWPKMTALILSGSALSASLSPVVAVASATAFGAAGFTNAVIYALLGSNVSRWWRMNISNVFAAAMDSVVFPHMAFDTVDWRLCLAQTICKIVGGAFFTTIFIAGSRHAHHRQTA